MNQVTYIHIYMCARLFLTHTRICKYACAVYVRVRVSAYYTVDTRVRWYRYPFRITISTMPRGSSFYKFSGPLLLIHVVIYHSRRSGGIVTVESYALYGILFKHTAIIFASCGEQGLIFLPWDKLGLTPADLQCRVCINSKTLDLYVTCNETRCL